MAEIAKIPSWRDMDDNQFLQHWNKRHSYPGAFDQTSERFPDDSKPIWFAIRGLHDKIHAGTTEDFEVPTDHIHLESVSKILEELL